MAACHFRRAALRKVERGPRITAFSFSAAASLAF